MALVLNTPSDTIDALEIKFLAIAICTQFGDALVSWKIRKLTFKDGFMENIDMKFTITLSINIDKKNPL